MQRHVPSILAGAPALVIGLAVAYAGAASAQSLSSAGTSVVPTYESVGLYWQSPGGTAGCEVKYRKVGDAAWAGGLPLWYDARDGQCRGSIVGLTQNTAYEVQLNLPGQAASRGLSFQTWANAKPIAQTIAVPSGSTQFNISQSGSPSGWIVYEGNGATLDGQNTAIYNIHVKAKYVIIRGLNLKGAKQDAIRLDPTSSDVIIEDNDISNWGRTRDGVWATNMDSAIRGYCASQDQLPRITIQRNRIHDPRYGANSWSNGHPAGAQAVAFSHCAGQLVIRHNDMYSTTGKYFNDIIGGEDNFTQVGFPNADSDIYGNKLSHAWDDGIESEGANENVRIWGNYIDRTAIGIATTATSVGPVYVFRNVWNRAQMYANISSLDLDERQPFFKSGGTDTLGHGRRYLLHNTMLQARQAGLSYGLGGGYAAGGTGSTQLVTNTFSKNNIYHLWKDGKGAFYQTGSQNEFAADLYNGTSGSATEVGGISGTPVYVAGHGWQNEGGGSYQLASNSPGYGKGVKIPNFNDGVAAPDVGAHQSGTAAMKFGVAASPGSSIGGSSGQTPLAAPVTVSPTGTITTTTPAYVWNASAGATSYWLLVQNLSGVAVNMAVSAASAGCSAGTGTCSYTPAIALAAVTWGWFVNASNSIGTSAWSESRQFTVSASTNQPPSAPTQVSPMGTITTTTPTYVWNASAGATSYWLLVQNLSGVAVNMAVSASSAGCSAGTGTCSFTSTTPIAGGAWGWFVNASNTFGTSAWSANRQFTVNAPAANQPPTAPSQVSPTGTITTTTPTYVWNASAGATSYWLLVQNLSGVAVNMAVSASSAGCSAGTGTCSFTPTTPIAGGAWGWFVNASNTFGTSAWSANRQFTVNAPAANQPPTAPSQVSPAGTINTRLPTYTWNASAGATSYWLLAQNLNGVAVNMAVSASSAGCSSGTGICSFTASSPLGNNATWVWYLRASNAYGTSAWSAGIVTQVVAP